MTFRCPAWFSPLDRVRFETAVAEAAPPKKAIENDPASVFGVVGLVEGRFASVPAAINAIASVYMVIADIVQQRRDRWATQPEQARHEIDDLLEDVILWAFEWHHPQPTTTTANAFAVEVRAAIEARVANPFRDVRQDDGSFPAKPAPDDRVPFSVEDAAERLGVSVDTLRRMEKAGTIAFHRFGKRVVKVPQAEIDRLLETGEYPKTR